MNQVHNALDDRLQSAVYDELNWEPAIAAAHIGVTARDGVVNLTGHVHSYAQKMAAERATLRVRGVKAVAEDIEVRLPFELRRRDDEIAAAAVDHLSWDASVPNGAIRVKVEKGVVTLTGEVEWRFQRDAAEQTLHRLAGVTRVADDITIKPKVHAETISDDIQHALHRSWFLDPELVHVRAEGGQVTLTGRVHSPHDRQMAVMTAWAAPGATSVQNDMTID